MVFMDLSRMSYKHILCRPRAPCIFLYDASWNFVAESVCSFRALTTLRTVTSHPLFRTNPPAIGVVFTHPRRPVSSSPKSRSFYDILEVPSQASAADIKSAYYKLSKQYHPDINQAANAANKFREISEAYETLGNSRSRDTYDSQLRSGSATYTYQSPRSYTNYRPGNRYTETEMPDFEERYRAFRAQQFGRRKRTAPPTGKTEYYDFDEFYRMHYQDVRARARNEERWADMKFNQQGRYNNFQDQVKITNIRSRVVMWFLFSIVFFVLLQDMLMDSMLTPQEMARIRHERERWEMEHMGRMRLIREDLQGRRRESAPRVVVMAEQETVETKEPQKGAPAVV